MTVRDLLIHELAKEMKELRTEVKLLKNGTKRSGAPIQ